MSFGTSFLPLGFIALALRARDIHIREENTQSVTYNTDLELGK